MSDETSGDPRIVDLTPTATVAVRVQHPFEQQGCEPVRGVLGEEGLNGPGLVLLPRLDVAVESGLDRRAIHPTRGR
jgi:hypothetical protein